MSPRVFLSQISPTAWEHPSEKAAYDAVRRRDRRWSSRPHSTKVEEKMRRFMLADAIRVGPSQRPQLYALYLEVLQTLDWPGEGNPVPELYVTAQRFRRSGASGGARPFIVMSSRQLDMLDREEQRFLIGRAVVQVISNRLHRSAAESLIDCADDVPFNILNMIGGSRDMMKWGKSSELSDDRGALLATQDIETALMTLLKMAGGSAKDDSLSVDAWLDQIAETDAAASAPPSADPDAAATETDGVHAATTAPPSDNTRAGRLARRARELRLWAFSAEYAQILGGAYVRRGQEPVEEPSAASSGGAAGGAWFSGDVKGEAREAVSAVGDVIEKAADAVGGVVNRAADALGDAFNTSGDGFGDLANRASNAFRDAFKAAQSAAKAAEERMDEAWRGTGGVAADPITVDYESPAGDTEASATGGRANPADPSSGPSAAPV